MYKKHNTNPLRYGVYKLIRQNLLCNMQKLDGYTKVTINYVGILLVKYKNSI